MAKLRKTDIEATIATEEYIPLPNGRTMICILTLKNGYTVTGEASVLDIANFDAQIGKDEARKVAFEKIWDLEGYLLMQQAYEGVANNLERDMDFGNALRALKRGKKVARTGWNGRDMWLSLSSNTDSGLPLGRSVPADGFLSTNNKEYATANGGFATVLPCITMKTASGEILMGWLASQSDMLSNDWKVVA